METIITGFWKRTLHFTERLIVCISVFFFLIMAVSVVLIAWAIHETGSFSYVDTLVTEMSVTFRDIVGIAIIKALVENVFKHNDFGGRLPKKQPDGEPDGEFMILEESEETEESDEGEDD